MEEPTVVIPEPPLVPKPTYRPKMVAECRMEFMDGEIYKFSLPLKMLLEVESTLGVGIGTVWKRIVAGDFSGQDCQTIIRCALVGGGLSGVEAKRLISTWLDDSPVETAFSYALAIMQVTFVGVPIEDQDKVVRVKIEATDG